MTKGTSRFAGKVAVVTGGGSGIGRATCLTLAEGGADVVVVSNVAEQAGAVAAEVCALAVKGIARTVDVTDLEAVEALCSEVEKDLGGANILVTCAGVMGARKLVTQITAAEWRQTIAVNLDGTFYCIRAFLPGMLARNWGRIITLSSASGKLPAALNSDYAASKHGVIGLTKTIAIELGMLGKNGVTANALCPGPIDTPMMEAITDHLALGMNMEREKFHKVVVAKNIQRRLLDPQEVASMAAHLASDEARGITGQAINVCGGMVLL
jgi:NAD(P)-dependent dehydrogenase (short-subunit alcohol dehydrogenase family)